MGRILVICSILLLFAASASAQKAKPWTEWSAKDAEKVLNDSAWGQTQTEQDSSSQPSSTSAITQTTAGKENQVRSADAAKNVESGETKAPAMAIHTLSCRAKQQSTLSSVTVEELLDANVLPSQTTLPGRGT